MYSSSSKDSLNDLKKSACALRDEAADAATDVARDARSAAHATADKMRRLLDTTTAEISQAAHTVSGQIQHRPVQSSVIALGVGFMIGWLFRR